MTIAHVSGQGGGAAGNNTTSVSRAFGSNVQVGSLIVIWGMKYTPSIDAFVSGDCTKSAGTATISAISFDASFNQKQPFDNKCAAVGIWSCLVTGAGSLTMQVGGSVAGSYLLIATDEYSGNWDSSRLEDSNSDGATPATSTTAISSGNGTSAGAALFAGNTAINNTTVATITEDTDFVSVYENTGASDDCGSAIRRIAATGETRDANWSITSTTVNAWAAALAVYKEVASAPEEDIAEAAEADDSVAVEARATVTRAEDAEADSTFAADAVASATITENAEAGASSVATGTAAGAVAEAAEADSEFAAVARAAAEYGSDADAGDEYVDAVGDEVTEGAEAGASFVAVARAAAACDFDAEAGDSYVPGGAVPVVPTGGSTRRPRRQIRPEELAPAEFDLYFLEVGQSFAITFAAGAVVELSAEQAPQFDYGLGWEAGAEVWLEFLQCAPLIEFAATVQPLRAKAAPVHQRTPVARVRLSMEQEPGELEIELA